MNQTDILRKRLVKELNPGQIWLIPARCYLAFWFISLFIPKPIFPYKENVQIFLELCLGFLILPILWQAFLRWLHPESNPVKGYLCFWFNIFFVLAFPACLIALRVYDFFLMFLFSIIVWVAFLLPYAIRINRLISALYRPADRQTREMASPCPEIFRRLNFEKSTLWLPLVISAIAGIPVQIFSGRLEGYLAGFVGIPALLFLPTVFIKQDAAPSAFQKFIRMITHIDPKNLPDTEFPAFYWWLSHPGWDWPENFEELAPFIDTDTFDWQNPNEWTEPLRLAREQLARQMDRANLPPLVIGSHADEWANALQAARMTPTSKITPLLAAAMHNNIQEMQQLLPTEEINRPYAGNGNTPLHIAAWNGYTDMARLLLAQPDIDKNVKNLAGKTPLDLAREQGHTEIIALLEK